MKKLLLLFLLIAGGVSTASATDLYVGACTKQGSNSESSWEIKGKMTDNGNGTYTYIATLPTFDYNSSSDKADLFIFTIFKQNSISWDDDKIYCTTSNRPWVDNSTYQFTMQAQNVQDYQIVYPVYTPNSWGGHNNARAIKIDFNTSTLNLTVKRLIAVASGYNGWSTTTDYLEETSNGSKIYAGYVPLEDTSANYDDGFQFIYIDHSQQVYGSKNVDNGTWIAANKANYEVSADGIYYLYADFTDWHWTDPVLQTVSASVGTYGMATLCSEYALDFTGLDEESVKAYAITGNDKTTGALYKTQVTGQVPAGTGLYIEGTANASINVPTTICETPLASNMLKGVLVDTPITQTEDDGDTTNYILTINKQGGNVDTPKFFKVNSLGNTVSAYKAYLQIPTELAARDFFWFDEDATAIESLTKAHSENVVYDLQGRRVAQPTKGLYIVNGKKVIR